MRTVFIDGREGTTGLRIDERLFGRADIRQITLPQDKRKDTAARKEALNEADIAFLCLPDAVAVQAVSLIENPRTRVIDASTAHRTTPGWVYGFPEAGSRNAIREARRIAVPGCHAGGFIALIKPLVAEGYLGRDAALTCHSITGYSGGGRKMIDAYEQAQRSKLLDAPRQYGLTQQHKHLKEMQAVTGLESAPIFCPIVSDFYSGMVMTVPLFQSQLLRGGGPDIRAVYQRWYQGPVVRYREAMDEEGFLSGNALAGKDGMEITVLGNEERLLLVARYDNLGKGASGAAVQCMNLMLGSPETSGLSL